MNRNGLCGAEDRAPDSALSQPAGLNYRRPQSTQHDPQGWASRRGPRRIVAGVPRIPRAPARRERSGQADDQRSVGPAGPRSGRASLEHSELVAQDEDLDLLGGVGSGAQPHQLGSLENMR